MRKSKEKMHFYYKNGLKNYSTTNGITLIALVITIIVLLILARCIDTNANRADRNTKKCRRSKQ